MTMSVSSIADAPVAIDRRRAFDAARRHSRLVRRLRIALPTVGTLIVAGLTAATSIGLPGDVDLSLARLSVTKNSIIMESPELTGFDADGRRYSLSADRAIQALAEPDAVRLEDISAEVMVPGQGTATISAEAGDYDNTDSTLQVEGTITIDSSQGYALRMEGADIDFGAGTMTSSNPVTVHYEDSRTTGQSIEVSRGGDLIVVEGGVRTTLMPPNRTAAGQGTE
jgi:lipopolysaccharide export system protein LptC